LLYNLTNPTQIKEKSYVKTSCFSTNKGSFVGDLLHENSKTVIVSFPDPSDETKTSVIKRHKVKHKVSMELCQPQETQKIQETQVPS